MAKRKFRKVYLVTAEQNVFTKYNYDTINIYRQKATADRICLIQQKAALDEAKMEYMKNQPVPQYTVHGFYLIHEKYFDENG